LYGRLSAALKPEIIGNLALPAPPDDHPYFSLVYLHPRSRASSRPTILVEQHVPNRFTAENWENLDNSGRIALCHTMGRTAMKLAKTSPFNISEAFMLLAESWSRVGTEITRASLPPPDRDPEPLAGV
jgi:hypothetical protein